MLPSSRIFRSRWQALLWAGGIVWMAWDFAGSAQSGKGGRQGKVTAITDASGDVANIDDLATIANIIDS